MSNLGPAPSLMTVKISPSLSPRSHFASVRSDGCVPCGAIGPLPLASAPWQNRQYFWKDAWPALIESGVAATGFLSFLASGLPPGFCAPSVTTAAAASAHTNRENNDEIRRMMNELLVCPKRELLILCQMPTRFEAAGPPRISGQFAVE